MTPDREPARGPPRRRDAVGVLTVDDQQVFRSAAREVIEATPGFTSVGEASCGEDALDMIDERAPDLVLVDVRMPGMDGIETTKRIKEGHPGLVVVLISIENHPNVPAAAAEAGAAELVSKEAFGSRLLRRLWSVHGYRT
jgi:two-component system, NarL family, invasion response regulator UvrY